MPGPVPSPDRNDAGDIDSPTTPPSQPLPDDVEPEPAPERDASAAGGASGSVDASMPGTDPADGGAAATLSERYPGDVDIAADPAVLFFDDFESGWGRWDGPEQDSDTLSIEQGAEAHAGLAYLRSSVTSAQLEAQEYISSQSYVSFPERVDTLYVRYYAQFVGTAPTPHHWVRVTAGTEAFNGSGLANTVPDGNDGFWFDFDANLDDVFNFYVYWYQMRSGRCNDGTAVEGCAGDQGSTYHYGNVFRPPEQSAFPRDQWFCIEIKARANTVGQSDGALSFWIDDQAVVEYAPGSVDGTWLRDQFHIGGCDFSACTEPQPFTGFDFRSSAEVRFKALHLDAYYERGSSADKRQSLIERGINVDDAQIVLYDDVVVATQRIGCRRD